MLGLTGFGKLIEVLATVSIMAKKYTINLSNGEVAYLRSLIKTGKSKARTIARAHILLMTSEGETDATSADRLRVSVSRVERTRAKLIKNGIEGTLNDRPHPPKPRKLDGFNIYHRDADVIRLVVDNLNTHNPASLYEVFEPQEARRIVQKLEFHYTPKHASWLNQVEIEFSVLSRQCLERRIKDVQTLSNEIATWEQQRNNVSASVNWRFKTTDARTKMERLYPTFSPCKVGLTDY